MNRRDIAIGVVIVLVLWVIIAWLRKSDDKLNQTPVPTPSVSESEKKLESTFKIDIPDDIDKAELKKTGDQDGSGIATREVKDQKLLVTVLADLPDPKKGYSYQVTLEKDEVKDEKQDKLLLGSLRVAKGGWLLETSTKEEYQEYPKVKVSLVDPSKKSQIMLEGSF